MVAAIVAEAGERLDSRNEQLEMIFEEIHKQAMANVLLDITGRIGTRQRDASAIVPQKNARAAAVITPQVVEQFAEFGMQMMAPILPFADSLLIVRITRFAIATLLIIF